MMSVLISLLAMLRGVVRARAALHVEILALRHQPLIRTMAHGNPLWGAPRIHGAVPRKNLRRLPVGSCGYRLKTILVVQAAEDSLCDDAMTITDLIAA